MLCVTYQRYGMKVDAIWFCDEERADQMVKDSKADVVFLHGVQSNGYKNSLSGIQHTLLTDLAKEPDQIFQGFGHSVRKQLRKAQKENIECRVYEAEDLKKDPSLLASFDKDFKEFAKLKSISNTYNRSAMKQYIENGGIMLSKAIHGGMTYAQHICIFDGETVRGLYSVSNFRSKGYDPGIAGLANRFLEWNDIQYFNRINCKTYDWGGLNKDSERNGVDQFKLGFGGANHTSYNVIVGRSFVGKMCVLLLRVVNYTKKM